MEIDLTNTNIEGAIINNISIWDIKKNGIIQKNLVITVDGEPVITVDNFEVAQFICLMVKNENIRNLLDSITSKIVLILGSYAEKRKLLFDTVKDELRKRDYLPILLDFEKPFSRLECVLKFRCSELGKR